MTDNTQEMNKISSFQQRPHILVVDDDKRIRDLVCRYLQKQDFVVCAAEDAAKAGALMKQMLFDAIVLDVMMPGKTGLEFTQDIRQDKEIPILLLTALGEVEDRITGLETGADDYLAKPFEPRELVLRLKALLKRAKQADSHAPKSYSIGSWVYMSDEALLKHKDSSETIKLTTVEEKLLGALVSRKGEAVSREELAKACDVETGERTIDVQVTRLRRKIEEDTKKPLCLQTVRGKGYLLRAQIL